MNSRSAARFRFDSDSAAGRKLVMCGLWLRAAFVGVMLFAAGVAALLAHEPSPIVALAIALLGAGLAILAWRRAHIAIDDLDGVDANAAFRTESPPAIGPHFTHGVSHASRG
jgi:hypothetical protein